MTVTRSCRLRKSATVRFLAIYLTICLACVVPVMTFLYYEADRILLADFTSRLERRRDNLVRHFEEGGIPQISEKVRDRIDRGLIDNGMILLVDASNQPVEGNLAEWPDAVPNFSGWRSIKLRRDGEEEEYLFLVSVTQLPSGYRFLTTGRMDDQEEVLGAMWRALLGAFGLAVFLSLLGSMVVVRQLNRMVNVVGDTASQIADGDLGQKVRRDYSEDPLDRLGAALNRMMDRIAKLMEENRSMTDALAHDLRSPLTRIHAMVDRAERAGANGATPMLQAIEHEVDTMVRMLDSTLEISRAESGLGRENFQTEDMCTLVRELGDMYTPLVEKHGLAVRYDCEGGISLHCNRSLIARALSNLIDNAIKYGGPAGTIRLGACRRDDGRVAIYIADSGSGIAPGKREEAIRKYSRLDDSRLLPGMGLGLSLVAAIARLHNGELVLEDNSPGLRASLVFSSVR